MLQAREASRGATEWRKAINYIGKELAVSFTT